MSKNFDYDLAHKRLKLAGHVVSVLYVAARLVNELIALGVVPNYKALKRITCVSKMEASL